MDIYVIVFEDELTPKLKDNIEKEWPEIRHFFFNPYVACIVQDEPILTRDLADKLGFNKDGQVRGVVVEKSAWNGFASNDFVEWARKAGEL